MATELADPPLKSGLNMSPIKCENAIHATAVIAAPNIEIKRVTLFAFTKGPDQNAIPVKIELYPNKPKVIKSYFAPNNNPIAAPINPATAIIKLAFREAIKTPARIKIPVIGELIKGTSEIPLNNI